MIPHLLHDLVSVERKSPTKDAAGGAVEGFSPVSGLESLPCSIQPLEGAAKRTLGQRQVFVTHAVYFDQDYGLVRGDRLLNLTTGKYLLVHGVVDQAGQHLVWEVQCREET